MRAAAVLSLVLAAAAAGCGGSSKPGASVSAVICVPPTTPDRASICGRSGANPEGKSPSTIVVGTRRVARPLSAHGFWRKAILSPDGKTVLAQWSGECEVQTTFFVAVGGGRPRAVTGEGSLSRAPASTALGWAADGRARVRLSQGACGRGFSQPGVYLIDPHTGARTLEHRMRGFPGGA